MTPSRTRAILEILRGGGDEAVSPKVLRVFGASSLEECLATYDAVGAAERRGLDEAVERIAGHIPTPSVPAVAPAPARVAADDASLAEWEHLYESPQPVPWLMQAYAIHRQLLSLGRSYRVEDPAGTHAFTVSGKVRFARTFSIRDAQGNLLYSVREKLWSIDPMFLIHRDGTEAAVLKRTTTSGATNDKFEIVLQSGAVLAGSGKLWDDDGVRIERDGLLEGVILREQNVIRERFRAMIRPSADQALLLAIAMSIVETDSSRGNGST